MPSVSGVPGSLGSVVRPRQSQRCPRGSALLVGAVVVAIVAGACRGPSPASPAVRPQADPSIVPVVSVVDGDTIRVLYRAHEERVRLIGIDAPEVERPDRTAECFGQEATGYLRGRLRGRRVRLAFDVDRRDRFDRLLAYVYLGDELVNLTMVRLGYAVTLRIEPDTSRATELARAEDRARTEGLGLWSSCRRE